MEQDKINKLEKLKKEIEDEFGKNKVWFFLDSEGYPVVRETKVKGYLGTQNIMFVAEIPIERNSNKDAIEKDEKNWKPSKNDKILYTTLNKFGFENAHLTDLVKLLKTQKEAEEFFKNIERIENQKVFQKQIEYLREEYNIIQPKIIIAMSRGCEKYLINIFGKEKVKYIYHYSYVGRYNKTKEYHEQMKEIKEEYEELRG